MSSAYAVVLSKLAQESFDKVIHSNRKIGEQIAKSIDRIALNPALGEFLKGEWKGYRRYRSGNYRIIYRVDHGQLIIYIITIDDRKDVYR